jgi:pimeloyl-ACP methyl ester carboxylesterase
MSSRRAVHGSDLAGVGRLVLDAVFGLTDVVEAMHGTIARRPFPVGTVEDTRTRGITRLVYSSIRGVTRLVGGGFDTAVALLTPPVGETTSSPRREVLLSVLNGVLGDHLAASQNPLAIPMRFRSRGEPIVLEALSPSRRLLVLVHGSCMNDLQWKRRGHDHGEELARAQGWTTLYLHYNTGRHISLNGRDFSEALEALVAAWPVPLDELALIGHSMGGLVVRSAAYYAGKAGHRWPDVLRKLVFLGTPHHGAPLERAGNLANIILEVSPYAAPLARVGGIRSAGIHDLRFGNIVDEDWAGRDRQYGSDPRTPVPLPEGVDCFTIAGTRGRAPGDVTDRLLGDGLVPVESALGRHALERFTLAFPSSHQRVFSGCDHLDLLDLSAVYEQIATWLP